MELIPVTYGETQGRRAEIAERYEVPLHRVQRVGELAVLIALERVVPIDQLSAAIAGCERNAILWRVGADFWRDADGEPLQHIGVDPLLAGVDP